MMTAASIASSSARGYADYLESRTATPERGDYYLGTDGAPAESPGRWLTPAEALGRVGVEPAEVKPDDLRALMEGRSPASDPQHPVWLRPTGADGTRAGGLDVTFSPPKPVSVAWAIGDPRERAEIERVHSQAVAGAVGYLRDTVALTHAPGGEPARARELHAAEFLHTTARGVAGAVPDPQLHSHVVITSVERSTGTVGAVRSRPAFGAAREVGAYYRARLAEGLRDLGYDIAPAGKEGRYFTIAGVSDHLTRAFSKRTEEVHRAAQRFRAEHGRDPERGELRSLAVKSREAKLPRTRTELDRAWHQIAAEHGTDRPPQPGPARPGEPSVDDWSARVLDAATSKRAVFDERELRCVALEQAAGTGLQADAALKRLGALRAHGAVLDLADGRLTTARMRALEQDLEQRVQALGRSPARTIPAPARERGLCAAEERIASPLTVEQRTAVQTLTEPQRATVLIGPAGTGKGVVIDAAAHAELAAGREVIGVAVAGRTAQRLGEDSPAFAGRVRTLDGLVTALEHDRANVGPQTTVYVDEAGMGDTKRLARLVDAVEQRGGSLVLIGDSRQLPSIGAGGMFERLHGLLPAAELSEVRRTPDPAEREAWGALRSGDPALAMAHYREHGSLHFSDTRTDAVDRAARRYLDLAAEHDHGEVALMTDASNTEVDALNLRVQQLRLEAGELGDPSVELPDSGHGVRAGDRLAWTRSMPTTDGPRVENGVRGETVAVDERDCSLRVRLDGSGRELDIGPEDTDALRLGYASHVYRQQGATVDRAVVVTGGWETSRESAYVEASRARDGVEWHVARDQLEGANDAARVDQLAALMRTEAAQTPSLAHDLAPTDVRIEGIERAPDLDPEPAAMEIDR